MAILLAGLVFALVGGGWWYLDGGSVAPQLAGYRIGQAASLDEARREIRRLEQAPDRETVLRELVAGWGTGNATFDFYLAQYLTEPECSDALRRTFSLELAWRPELLRRWAWFWSWHVKQPLREEIGSIADYLDTLARVEPPRKLTWREVLSLQAVFALTGAAEQAQRLGPDNWPARYRAWRTSPDWSQLERPDQPLPDWQGPLPR